MERKVPTTSSENESATLTYHTPTPGADRPSFDATSKIADPALGATAIVAPPAAVVAPLSRPAQASASAPLPELTAPKVARPPSAGKSAAKPGWYMTALLASAAAVVLLAAIFLLARKHRSPVVSSAPAPATIPAAPVTTSTAPDAASPEPTPATVDVPVEIAPEESGPEQATSADLGSVIVVAGQDKAQVFLDGKLQPQLTRNGQLRIRNLEPKDYVVRVSKNGFQDLPERKIRIRKGERGKLIFNLQPVPHWASLSIQGGVPGSSVLIDQTPVGTIQADGTLTFATVNPGDRTIEIRKDRFKAKQIKKHFVVGSAVSLTSADVALEAAPGQLKITFTPVDAQVTVAKAGEAATKVSSGSSLSLAAGSYTITAKTSDNFSRSSTVEVNAGQSKNLDLSLAPEGISRFDDPSAWKQEKGSFVRKGGDFVMYNLTPTSGTFVFSAMLSKGHRLQWVLNCTDVNDYILFQMDDNNFYRTVIKNGQKGDEIKIPHKTEKKSFRTIQIRVSPNEIVHQIRQGDGWLVLDRWALSGSNLSLGKFGFYIPGNDQVALSSFSHYVDLSTR